MVVSVKKKKIQNRQYKQTLKICNKKHTKTETSKEENTQRGETSGKNDDMLRRKVGRGGRGNEENSSEEYNGNERRISDVKSTRNTE